MKNRSVNPSEDFGHCGIRLKSNMLATRKSTGRRRWPPVVIGGGRWWTAGQCLALSIIARTEIHREPPELAGVSLLYQYIGQWNPSDSM
jgi:hypothetical protein